MDPSHDPWWALGGVDAFPLCLATKDVDQIVAFATARTGPDWTRPGLVMLVSVAASADTRGV
jgi:hypothetical protein